MTNHSLPSPSPATGLNLKIAFGRRELSEAFRLVYRRYRDKGYAASHSSKMLYHPSFGQPSSRTIVATTTGDEIVGTVTVVGDNKYGFQLDPFYRAEIRDLQKSGRRLGEVTCLAIKPTSRLRPREVFFGLTHFMIHYAFLQKFDDLLISIHPRHHRFYWHHFRVSPLGSCHSHTAACDNPAIGCRMDLYHLGRNVDADIRESYLKGVRPESHYNGPPISEDDHRHFCKQRSVGPYADGADRDPSSQEPSSQEAA